MFKMSRRVERAYWARLEGLKAEQIKAQLELDVRVFADTTHSNQVRNWFHDAGLPLVPNCIYYGLHAEDRGSFRDAVRWLEWSVTNGNDQVELRRFFIRQGMVARASAFSLTKAEEQRVICNRLKRVELDHLNDARAELLACIQLGGKEVLTPLLYKCCRLGLKDSVKRVADLMGYQLTAFDRGQLGRGLIQHYPTESDTWDYLVTHKLRHLMPIALTARLRVFDGTLARDIEYLERRFKIRLTVRQMDWLLDYVKPEWNPYLQLNVATLLAKRSAKWQQRRERLIAKMRRLTLASLDYERAELYGQQISQPPTPSELLAQIVHARSRDNLYARLYARTCETLNLKPVADQPAG